MLKNTRRGTFVLSDRCTEPSNMSGIDKQNVMRLRINRIALVQEIRVEHIIHHLMENGVVQEDDLKKIEKGSTPADKSRRLIDLVATKTNVQDWYQTFREALQNPDGEPEVKRRYRELVEFLDNTVIHRPNSQQSKFSSNSEKSAMRLPHYPPLPSINNYGDEFIVTTKMDVLNLDDRRKEKHRERMEEMEKGMKDTIPETNKIKPWSHEYMESQTLVKGFFQQWVPTPENYRSLVQVPEDHFQALQDSSLPEDKAQLEQETQALEKIRKLELVAVMSRRKLLPDGFELCMCDIVHEILFNPDLYHLYFKYLRTLQVSEVYLLVDIVKSFASVMTNLDPAKGGDQTQQGIKIGFHLIDFLADYGYFKEAEMIMTVLMKVLNRTHNIETWMAKYKGFVKLMKLRNLNYEFMKVQMAYNLAVEMTWQIKLMSFGQDLLNETELFIELGQLMFEYGSTSSFGWAQKALRAAKESNPEILVHALCSALVAYCAKWSIKKAERLAVFTVQKAAQHFGKRHPLYLKALLHFCYFSNEFKQDQAGVDIAKYTLETAQKIYGCDTIQVAMSHRAVCKAMLALQNFDDPAHNFHAMEGLKIARSLLPENHPLLYLFLHTSATALQWKALHSSKAEQEATLGRAEVETKEALEIVSQHYGEISLRTGQMCLLLGQIYSKMDKILLAEEMLQRGVMYMKLCQPEYSNFLQLAAATLGTFYKVFDKPREAIIMFKDVVKHLEPVGVYLKWVHVCYEHLISTLQSLNRNKEADEIQIQLSQWLRDNKVYDHVITLEELHTKPVSFSNFMDEFDVWDKTAKKILSLALTEAAAK